jgi:signal transduction histidine kinase
MSLAGWWLYFGITTLSQFASEGVASEVARHQRMLFFEGSVLLVSLLVGGLALFYFTYSTYKEKSAKEMFFASFTHDLKTALFRMQLEVEKLGDRPQTQSLLKHTRKMQINLENSLDSTVGEDKQLYIENVQLKNFLLDLHAQWPEFHIKVSGEDQLPVDRKALHSIFKNLLHNSVVHGGADEVSVSLTRKKSHFCLRYVDNGRPFTGNPEVLGQEPTYSMDGSGFGLYIVRRWVQRMGGQIEFESSPQKSLQVTIQLPRRVA